MAKQNYNECLNRLLKDEGGYTNHPDDKGGPTNFGITIADYRRYIMPSATQEDVKNMLLSDAKKIYRKRYWDAIDADNLPSGIDYCLFDYGVNSGVGRVRTIKGKFAHLMSDPVKYINAVCDERLAFMKSIRGGKDWQVFGRGWFNRVAGVRKRSIQLATSTPVKEAIKTGGIAAAIGGFFTAVWAWGASHWQYFVAAVGIAVIAWIVASIIKFNKEQKNVG